MHVKTSGVCRYVQESVEVQCRGGLGQKREMMLVLGRPSAQNQPGEKEIERQKTSGRRGEKKATRIACIVQLYYVRTLFLLRTHFDAPIAWYARIGLGEILRITNQSVWRVETDHEHQHHSTYFFHRRLKIVIPPVSDEY
jgi:hypothetical protein